MKTTLHHVHLFASDLEKSIQFYCDMFGAKVIFDREMAGARNVLISIGTGKINFYDQPANNQGRGVVHHLGIETSDLEGLVEHMKGKGYKFKKPLRNHGTWKYIMAEASDNMLLELFQIINEGPAKDQIESFSSL